MLRIQQAHCSLSAPALRLPWRVLASAPPARRSPRTARPSSSRAPATCSTRARARTRSPSCRRSASKRCASSSTGATSRPARQRHQARVRRDQPRQLHLGRIRRADQRSAAPALEGAADRHLARAALGDVEQESALRHEPRRPGLRTIHDRRRPPLRLGGRRCSRSGTSPTTPPSCARSSTPTASRPRRASTAASTRPATRGCRPAGIAHPQVLIGETAPFGYDTVKASAQRRRQSAAARRRPAGVPARIAVPERPLQEIGLLRPAADGRLRPPRLHAARRPLLQAARSATTSRSACSRGCPSALDKAARAHAIPAACRST